MDPPNPSPPSPPGGRGLRLGLPVWAIVVLGALAAPRVVLHDLDVIDEGSAVNALFVFVPPLIWVAVIVWRRVPNPLVTAVAIGGVYGVLLAVGHNVLWDEAFGDDPPRLGGNLEGELSPGVEETVLRLASAVSSVMTGLAIGAVCGLVAIGLARLRD